MLAPTADLRQIARMNSAGGIDRRTVQERLLSDLENLHALGVRSLALFGSVARDEARPGSDVDVLVEFEPPIRYERYCAVRERLEELLECRVDLLTVGALREELRATIERDLLRVA